MQKVDKIRLKGKALADLNIYIHDRDEDQCILCHAWVPIGVKFHHEPIASEKQDTLQTGLLLCYFCHQERHFGRDSADAKNRCERYLRGIYG